MTYIIEDWAGNKMNNKGQFECPSHAVPKQFKTFEDGWDWIYTNIEDEEAYQDLYVVESEGE